MSAVLPMPKTLPDAARRLAMVLDLVKKKDQANRMRLYYPDEDTVDEDGVIFPARHKYPRHLEMFRRGADVFARMFRAANGAGKSELSLYELICQMRGWYPHWWEGRTFDGPIDAWICGQSSETVRSIQQLKMLGHPKHEGTGMLPADWLEPGSVTRSGVPGAIDTFSVKHVSGKLSHGQFKSYKQGVESFFGPEKHAILLDELPTSAIFAECVARTRNRPGAYVMVTCSPKKGNTETVKLFHEKTDPSRIIIPCGWADVPHLTEEWKAKTRANTPRYLLPATEFGEVGRGAGAVYEALEEDIVCNPFPIPKHFRWLYAMDGGYHNTAAVWIAYDKDNNKAYIVDEYKDGGGGTDLSVHAARILKKNRDRDFEKMPGVGDVAAISQINGEKLLTEYRKYGLALELAKKGVDAGTGKVRAWLNGGQLKIFSTCLKWFEEFRNYSYEVDDEGNTGKIVKLNDHCLHPDTMVIARVGKVAIRDLVGTSGEVWSIGGYQPYRNCRMTAADQAIVEVLLSDGSSVKCTPDHRFMTPRGWIEARDLIGEICENTVPHSIHKETVCPSQSYPPRFKSMQEKGIISVGTTSSVVRKGAGRLGSMSLSGLTRMAIPLQRATTSTTKTGIVLIIKQSTLSFLSVASTCLITTLASAGRFLKPLCEQQLSGINPRLAWNGIASITRSSEAQCTERQSFYARTVEINSLPKSTGAIGSAPTAVRALGAGLQGLMTSALHALVAGLRSRKISIRKPTRAEEFVAVKCVGVRAAGRSDVYCLTVPGTEAFAIENGAIVHNCMDATRYAIMSVEDLAGTPKRKTVEWRYT